MSDPHRAVRALVVGLGCQRGTPVEALRRAVSQVLATAGLALSEVGFLASSLRKQDEPGVIALAAELQLKLVFFAEDELARTGFDPDRSHDAGNMMQVAEPAAILASAGGVLLVPKAIVRDAETDYAITVAVARCPAGRP